HLGHQLIFKRVMERASEIRGTSLVYTFEPHPLRVLAPDKAPPLITTLKEKAEMIEAAGIDILICEPFTKDFANKSPKSFIAETLWDHIHMKEVFVGHDYAFGKNREGTIELLTEMGARLGFNVTVVDNIEVDHVPVRSTYIRDEILQGNVRRAGRLLGRQYSLPGIVVRGARRKIGFPTANITQGTRTTPSRVAPSAIRRRRLWSSAPFQPALGPRVTSPSVSTAPSRVPRHSMPVPD
ncbi:MAG: hypothetical protein JSV91_00470, partial [Phycisphaerales bacterium]